MTIYQFFAVAAMNLRQHYLDLAYGQRETDPHITQSGTQAPQSAIPEVESDSFEPTVELPLADPTEDGPDEYLRNAEADVNKVDQKLQPSLQPDGTYFFQRRSKLDYKLDLRFDLQAISQTVEQLSEGDLKAAETLFAGGFGLEAAMKFSGKQITETNMTDNEANPVTQMQERSFMKSRLSQQLAIQNRQFALQAFHRESTDVMKSLKVTNHDGYQRTVNKFTYRFKMDSQLSFAFLDRFNVQTQGVAEQMPESLGGYLNSAGNIVEKASTEMIGSFFDAVDAYLDGAEEQILEKVNQFFDMAAEQLGMSGALVDQAREQLVETVESFFDRVDTALESVESFFVPTDLEQPTLPIGEPEVIPVDYENPAVTEEKTEIAVA